jgi:hypothetical protein
MPGPDPDYSRPLFDIPGAVEKYRKKMDHVRQHQVLKEISPRVHIKGCVAQVQLFNIKDKVQKILMAQGVLSDYVPSYYAYAWALNKSQRKYSFLVDRIREHQILRAKWEAKGLIPSVLDLMDQVLIFAYGP